MTPSTYELRSCDCSRCMYLESLVNCQKPSQFGNFLGLHLRGMIHDPIAVSLPCNYESHVYSLNVVSVPGDRRSPSCLSTDAGLTDHAHLGSGQQYVDTCHVQCDTYYSYLASPGNIVEVCMINSISSTL